MSITVRPQYLVGTLVCLVLTQFGSGCGRAAADTQAASSTSAPTSVPTSAPAVAAQPEKKAEKKKYRNKKEEEAAIAAEAALTAQVPVPALPANIDQATTAEQLAAQAWIVAHEEAATDSIDGVDVSARQSAIMADWLPRMLAKQADLAAIRSTREARAAAEAQEAHRVAVGEAKIRKMEADYDRQITAENAKMAPIFPQ